MSGLLLCFSHLRWDFVYQRPQHLMSRAAREREVIYFEEPMFEESNVPRLDLSSRPGGVRVAVPILSESMDEKERIRTQRRLLDGLLADESAQALWCWYYTPMALAFSEHLRPDVCIYDCMDELSAFRFAPARLKELEAQLMARSHLVFTGGRSLYRAKKSLHPSCHAFPSSVDVPHFAQARASGGPPPADQSRVPEPRVGFFGVIDERMDLQLVDAVAAIRPQIQFVFIGPVVKIDPEALPRRDNIHWLGMKHYGELPAYLREWRAAFMPFALNESTRYISPTKTPEFLAAGLPVCSTPIADVVDPYAALGLVEIGATAEEVGQCLDRLIAGVDASWQDKVDRYLRRLSWDRTWEQMHELIRGVERSRAARSRRAVGAALTSHEAGQD